MIATLDASFPDKEFQEYLARGQFMIQRSASTGTYVFYPRIAIPGSGETDLEWVEASGDGTVYSSTIIRVKPPGDDFSIVLIDLAEGPRMMSRLTDIPPEDIKIGMAVKAYVGEVDGAAAILFRPATGDAA